MITDATILHEFLKCELSDKKDNGIKSFKNQKKIILKISYFVNKRQWENIQMLVSGGLKWFLKAYFTNPVAAVM